MKKGLIIVGGIISLLIILRLYVSSEREGAESYSYSVIKKYDDFEVRKYEERLFSTVQLPYEEYSKAGGLGFRILSSYIYGENEKKEQIDFTLPVVMSLEDSMTVMMMIPKGSERESLPKPDNSNIKHKKVPSKTLAAITFDHRASDEEIQLYKEKLINALEAEGIAHKDRFYFMAYNSPLDLFDRKNEVVVELIIK